MTTRKERVVLDLIDNFSSPMMRAAAATELLDDRVRALSGSSVQARSSGKGLGDDIDRTGVSARRASADINQFSGRLATVAQLGAALGPGLIPIAAVGIPAVTGLASSFGFAAVAGATAITAFQGVGGALEAMNKAHLEPTAENLAKAKQAMQEISPAAQEFVKQLRSMGPELKGLRDTAAEGMFPGLSEGLDALQTRLPDVQRIIGAVAGELGDIASDSGASLAGARWDEFFTFLATDAPSALRDMATGTGNVTHALAEMWMAFDPVNDQFSSWLVGVTADFDRWATGLSGSTDLQEFFDYLRQVGPQVADTMGALGNALLQIVQAAAPIGGPVLAAVEAFADAIASIADSDLGTPIFGMIAALSALRLAMRATAAVSATMGTSLGRGAAGAAAGGGLIAGATGAATKARGSLAALRSDLAMLGPAYAGAGTKAERFKGALGGQAASIGKAGAAVAGLAVLTTGAGESMGVTNTASLALMGTMAGPWGAAIGGAAGLLLDAKASGDQFSSTLRAVNAAAAASDFSAVNAGLAKMDKQIKDTKDFSFDQIPNILAKSIPVVGNKLAGDGPSEMTRKRNAAADAAEAMQNLALRERGAGLASQFMAAQSSAAAQGMRLTAAGAANASGSVRDFARSLASANRALTNQSSFDTYKTALLDARQAMRDNGRTLNSNTRAGLANRAMLRNVAGGAAEMGSKMRDASKRMQFMDKARGDFIRLARGMGAGRAEAGRLADRFGLVDQMSRKSSASVNNLNARIRALRSKIVEAKQRGAEESSSKVQNLRAQIAGLQSKKVEITTVHTTIMRRMIQKGVMGAGGAVSPTMASGGTVPGRRLPYGDKEFIFAAPGEEVISNDRGQADRHRALLQAISANRYAGGGTVGQRVSVAAPNVNLAGALAGASITAMFPGVGQVVGKIVDERVAQHEDMRGMRERAVR